MFALLVVLFCFVLQLFGGSRDDASLQAHGQGPIPAQTPQPRPLAKYMIDAEIFHVKRDLSKWGKSISAIPCWAPAHSGFSLNLGIKSYLAAA